MNLQFVVDKGKAIVLHVESERIFEKHSRGDAVEKPMALGLEVRLGAVSPLGAA